jgi:hypothetical protein
MSKTIKIKLDAESINEAIKEIEQYRLEIDKKIGRFIKELISEGLSVANAYVGIGQGDSTPGTVSYEISSTGDVINAAITLSGKDAVFIEFGAGIAYNTGTQHPKAEELGFEIGSYPSKHPPNKAINPGYWYYGGGIRSIGTEATMPLYHSAEEMRNIISEKAMEIFG